LSNQRKIFDKWWFLWSFFGEGIAIIEIKSNIFVMAKINPHNKPNYVNQNFIKVSRHTSLLKVIEKMNQGLISIEEEDKSSHSYRVSCAFIEDEDSGLLEGLITERDIVRLTSQKLALESLIAEEVMTTNLVKLSISELGDVVTLIDLFQQYKIRHLPVVDNEGKLVGIVTPNSIRESLQPIDIKSA